MLLLTPDLEAGGAQATVRALAGTFPRTGCPVVVCTFRDGPLGDDIRRMGVPVEVLPDRRHSIVQLPGFVREVVQRRRELVALVDRHDVDVAVTFALGTWELLVLTLARRVQVWWRIGNVAFTLRPEHLTAHRWLLRPKQAAHRWLRRAGARVVDGIVAVSDDTARAVVDELGVAADTVTVVVNGVDVDSPPPTERAAVRASLGAGPDAHVLTMVGTCKQQKGHVHLLDAVAAIAGRLPTLTVWLVGDGPLRPAIEARITALGLDDRVRLLGTRDDVPALLAASDSFVLPSLWEGMSVALLEAMAARLPVIATAVSGTTEILTDGVDGWVVPPADPDALAAAIAEVVTDPAEATRRAAAARRRVEAAYSTRRTAEQLRSLFHDAARRRTTARDGVVALPDRRAG